MRCWKNRPVNPLFTDFRGVQDMSQKRRPGYISGTIFTCLGYLVLGVGLVFIKKIVRFTYSY